MRTSVEHLYQDHHQWLYHWLAKKLNNPHFAEDIAQDTFVSVIEQSQNIQHIREHRAFLLTIAKRKLFNFWRRQDLERAYLQSLHEVGIEQNTVSAEQLCLLQDALIQIDQLLQGLTPLVQQAFLLKKLELLTHPEIAQIMNISLASVERYIKQATVHCLLKRTSMLNP